MEEMSLVCLAENGADALAVLADVDVDLVVSDLNMPVMDGQTLLAEMRSGGYTPLLMLISGHATPESEIVLAADAFLPKPFTFADLVETAEGLLERVPA